MEGADESQAENHINIVLIGDGNVGKTMLVNVFSRTEFITDYIPTVLDIYTTQITLGNKKKVKAEIIDTAGQEDFWRIRKTQLQRADVVLICYSIDSYATLDNCETNWIKEVQNLSQKPVFILVGTKQDLEGGVGEPVLLEDAQKVAKDSEASDLILCSSLTFANSNRNDGNVEKVFSAAIKYACVSKGIVKGKKKGCVVL